MCFNMVTVILVITVSIDWKPRNSIHLWLKFKLGRLFLLPYWNTLMESNHLPDSSPSCNQHCLGPWRNVFQYGILLCATVRNNKTSFWVSTSASFRRPRTRTWHTILLTISANDSKIRCEPISAIALYHIEAHWWAFLDPHPLSYLLYNVLQYGGQ